MTSMRTPGRDRDDERPGRRRRVPRAVAAQRLAHRLHVLRLDREHDADARGARASSPPERVQRVAEPGVHRAQPKASAARSRARPDRCRRASRAMRRCRSRAGRRRARRPCCRAPTNSQRTSGPSAAVPRARSAPARSARHLSRARRRAPASNRSKASANESIPSASSFAVISPRSIPSSPSASNVAWAASRPRPRRASAVAVVAERLERLRRQRVHGVRTDQLLDVDDVRVVGVLGARAGPQQALGLRALALQRRELRAAEEVQEVPVGDLGVGDGDLAQQRARASGDPFALERRVDRGVHAADEEARHRGLPVDRVAVGPAPLQAADPGLRDLLVAGHAEQQRDVDAEASARDELLEGDDARRPCPAPLIMRFGRSTRPASSRAPSSPCPRRRGRARARPPSSPDRRPPPVASQVSRKTSAAARMSSIARCSKSASSPASGCASSSVARCASYSSVLAIACSKIDGLEVRLP